MILQNKNYKSFFIGRFTSNVGDSFFFQLVPLFLLTQANSQFWITINGFLAYLPYLILPLIALKLDQRSNKVRLLVLCEFINLIITCVLLVLVIANGGSLLIVLVAACYYFMITVSYNVQNSFFKVLVEEQEILSFVRIYELTGSVADVVLDAISTGIIQTFGFIYSLIANIFTFIISIFSFKQIKLKQAEDIPTINHDISKVPMSALKRNKIFFSIVCTDSLANGFTTMAMIILPVFLQEQGMLLYLPFLLFAKGMAGVVGLYFSKYLKKININKLYALSYLLYAIGMFLFINSNNILILCLTYFVAFLLNSALLPFYSEMMITNYTEHEISQVTSYIQLLLVLGILLVTVMSALLPLSSVIYFQIAIAISTVLAVIQLFVSKLYTQAQ